MNHKPRWWGDLKLDQLHPASTTTQVSSDGTNVRYRYAAAHRPLSALHPPRAFSMFTVTSRPFTRRSRAPIKRRRKSAPRDEARAWHPSRDGWQNTSRIDAAARRHACHAETGARRVAWSCVYSAALSSPWYGTVRYRQCHCATACCHAEMHTPRTLRGSRRTCKRLIL